MTYIHTYLSIENIFKIFKKMITHFIQLFFVFMAFPAQELTQPNNTIDILTNSTNPEQVPPSEVEIKFTNQEDKRIDYEYYKNFNLTEEIEKRYDEKLHDEKSTDFYSDLEKVQAQDGEKEKKKSKKQRKKEEQEKENQEWEENVKKFSPEDMLTVLIPKNDLFVFYEEIQAENLPVRITLAYYCHEDVGKIDFIIVAPDEKTISKIKKKNRLYYQFNATMAGIYEFHLENQRYKSKKQVSFGIHVSIEAKATLHAEHLNPIAEKLNQIDDKMKETLFSQQMIGRKYESHYSGIKTHNKTIVTYSLLETAIMIVILVVQLVYLKRLINKKAE